MVRPIRTAVVATPIEVVSQDSGISKAGKLPAWIDLHMWTTG